MAQISRRGFGQVEPNHLSAQHAGQIYAQLPCNADIEILENGQFAKYDYAAGEVNFTGEGEFMLVMNEIKNYDERYQGMKDFAYRKEDFTPGSDITHEGIGPFKGYMYPRLLKTNIGDIFTTNTFGANTGRNATVNGIALEVGDKVTPGTDGYLAVGTGADGQPTFKVVKVYTMPDGQPGVKLQRIS